MTNNLIVLAISLAFPLVIQLSNLVPGNAGQRGTPAVQAGAAIVQTGDPTGVWQATGFPQSPWVFELKAEGTRLTGTVNAGAGTAGRIEIYDGKVSATTVGFKVKSADGDRTITFTGRVHGSEMSLTRLVEVRAGGSRGGSDVFGASAVVNFVARRTR